MAVVIAFARGGGDVLSEHPETVPAKGVGGVVGKLEDALLAGAEVRGEGGARGTVGEAVPEPKVGASSGRIPPEDVVGIDHPEGGGSDVHVEERAGGTDKHT